YEAAYWNQVQVQVDERDYRLAYEIYKQTGNADFNLPFLVYTNPEFFTGPDTNPLFDENDELVFMAKDAGGPAPDTIPWPIGAIGGAVEVQLIDPLTGDSSYVYLFPHNGSFSAGAGADYVSYDYQLLAGNYLDNYILNMANPEDSWVETDYYAQHFSDDWIKDILQIYAGSATGVDILDHAKILLGPGLCNRSIQTYSESTGVHISSKDGPVRGIRSIFGANSGPLIERNHFFYQQMEVVDFWIRLHFIRGFLRFYDLSAEAQNMTFYSKTVPEGFTIDGLPDSLDVEQVSDWVLYTGEQGSLLKFDSIYTTFPIDTFWTYYEDQWQPAEEQCTGDGYAIGASGYWLLQIIPDTDPRSGSEDLHYYKETSYFLNPDLTPEITAGIRDQHRHPLQVHFRDNLNALHSKPSGITRIQVYPNPSSGSIYLAGMPANTAFTLQVFGLDGRQHWTCSSCADNIQLPDSLRPGLYLLRIEGENGVEVLKLVLR
ncbi:MAG: T9SS type A sorting domain-containing protein, partial [Phaeodactylibacter sp.]|nr:T9SS type A sorting domain-containing protein [Phaeodactylibacter sp.]